MTSERNPGQAAAPFHKEHIVPMSFFNDDVRRPFEFLSNNEVGEPIGLDSKAYLQ
jgi:hypothetical protein